MKIKFYVYLWLFLSSLFVSYQVQGQPYAGRAGVEISERGLFVDIVKEKYRFEKRSVDQSGNVTYSNMQTADVNIDRWPNVDFRYTFDGRPIAEFRQGDIIDDPDVYRVDYSGVYKGSFNGQATLKKF